MPTSELLPEFRRDYAKLTEGQKKAFRAAVKKFVIDLRQGGNIRGSLRVKPMQDNPNIFEMTWGSGRSSNLRLWANAATWREARALATNWGHDIFAKP